MGGRVLLVEEHYHAKVVLTESIGQTRIWTESHDKLVKQLTF